MPKHKQACRTGAGDSNLLLEPSLTALRAKLAASAIDQQDAELFRPSESPQTPSSEVTVLLSGVGCSPGEGCELSRSILLSHSSYYQHACSFGAPPAGIALDFGHRSVELLAAALSSGRVRFSPTNVADLLQAASFLQVAAVLQAAEQYLQDQVLDGFPGAVLRVALDLQLASLERHIQQDFFQRFFMLSGSKAAALLKEWPPATRRNLLLSPHLCAPTECCLIETLCHLAKAASSPEAVALLDCVRFGELSGHEVAATTLYLQANAKWADRRLCTALGWRLLNARVAADLGLQRPAEAVQEPRQLGPLRQQPLQQQQHGRDTAAPAFAGAEAAAGPDAGPREAARRAIHYGLRTASLESWTGTAMYCCRRAISCSWGPSCPMVLQLEREDPRHAAQEAVCGTSSGGGGATGSGGTGWDLQLSLDPCTFPAGFRATCFAFGCDGFYWCGLGPLAKAGPTWWKVGFLSSQLPHALPLALLGSGGYGGLLLVGWWVPEQ